MTKDYLDKANELDRDIYQLQRLIKDVEKATEVTLRYEDAHGLTCLHQLSKEDIDILLVQWIEHLNKLKKEFKEM